MSNFTNRADVRRYNTLTPIKISIMNILTIKYKFLSDRIFNDIIAHHLKFCEANIDSLKRLNIFSHSWFYISNKL